MPRRCGRLAAKGHARLAHRLDEHFGRFGSVRRESAELATEALKRGPCKPDRRVIVAKLKGEDEPRSTHAVGGGHRCREVLRRDVEATLLQGIDVEGES